MLAVFLKRPRRYNRYQWGRRHRSCPWLGSCCWARRRWATEPGRTATTIASLAPALLGCSSGSGINEVDKPEMAVPKGAAKAERLSRLHSAKGAGGHTERQATRTEAQAAPPRRVCRKCHVQLV